MLCHAWCRFNVNDNITGPAPRIALERFSACLLPCCDGVEGSSIRCTPSEGALTQAVLAQYEPSGLCPGSSLP